MHIPSTLAFVISALVSLTAASTVVPALGTTNCLSSASNADNAIAEIEPCNGGTGQQWTYSGGTLTVYGNKCLTVPGGSTANGVKLTVLTCSSGNANQQWTYTGTAIQWTGKGECVDATGGSVAAGNQVQVWGCSGGINQGWTISGASTSPTSTTSTTSTTSRTSTTTTSSAPLTTQTGGLGTSCTAPLGAGTAASGDPYWLQTIAHLGTSAFNANPSTYKVYRSVKDYGATGNGVTDDTAAINAAIADQNRCGNGCPNGSTSTSPAIVYFPSGTYLISSPIISFYFTLLIGDGKHPPTIKGTAGFNGIALIDVDPYTASGQYYVNQDNFYRSIRNFILDTTAIPPATSGTGIHWQVAQATSLQNIVVNMSTASGNNHQGIFMENGSGGFISDFTTNGGKFGIWIGNQQFTVRNLVINNAQTGIYLNWDWGWTFQGVTISGCQIGIEVNTGGTTQASQAAGSVYVLDSSISNTPEGVVTTTAQPSSLAGGIILDNVKLSGVTTAVSTAAGATVFAGPGTGTIGLWAQGNVYSGTSGNPTYVQRSLNTVTKPSALLAGGSVFTRSRPQYETYAVSQFISVKSQGAHGDGHTDDTALIQSVLNKYTGCKIIYFDAGTYLVTGTIHVPVGTIVVGEAWPVILASGSSFADQTNPKPVFQVGSPGDIGTVEISSMLFSTVAGSAGAVMIEWNIHDAAGNQGTVALWDSHVRLGGAAGTNLQASNCPAGGTHSGTTCQAAYMSLHITPGASGYFENMWLWTADHDLDQGPQVDIYAGRGILDESTNGPVWLIGTAAEHHVLYQYNIASTKNVFAGLIQTESPYYQPTPAPPAPFSINTSLHDPSYPSGMTSSWGLYIQNSQNVLIGSAGLYSFFSFYNQDCLTTFTCQTQIANVDTASSNIWIYQLSTVGVTYQLSVGGTGIINENKNADGFAETVTIWTPNSILSRRESPRDFRM